jgi:pimeloyl-ACP methyl ester carboxylesterase
MLGSTVPYLHLPEVDLFYQARGQGRPAVFLHGFGLDHSMWLDQLRSLADQRHCLAVDLRGFGRSEPGPRPALAATSHLNDILALISSLGEDQVDLVGHSMGGHVALAVATVAPTAVRSLALIGVMAPPWYPPPRPRSPEHLLRPQAELARRFAFGMLAPGASLMARARAVAMIEGMRWEMLYPEAAFHLSPAPSSLPMPLLLATGAQDQITPASAVAEFAAQLGATFLEIPNAGHLAPVENPKAIAQALASLWTA